MTDIPRSVNYILALAGGKAFQPAWEIANRISLALLNFGSGSFIHNSGELYALEFVKKSLGNDTRPIFIFDVGANVGEYTIAASRCFSDAASSIIYSFEPTSKIFAILKNKVGNLRNVRARQIGLSDVNRTAQIYQPQCYSGNASIYQRRLDHFNMKIYTNEAISLKKLDDFCKDEGIKHIHLLKLDVEGHELNVLKGAGELFQTNDIDFIQFEFGGCNIDSRTYFQDFFYLLNPKYRIFRILQHGLYPIDRYKETYEVFITTNYLAVSREFLHSR